MEAKTKIMAAVAVIVMCAAGLVGAGYAYTASTTNDGNSASSEYITLTQSSTGKYDFAQGVNVYWDSVDIKDRNNTFEQGINHLVTKYTLTAQTTAVGTYTMVKVGNTFQLDPVFTGGAYAPGIVIAITADMDKPADGVLILKTTTNGASEYFLLTAEDTFKKITEFPDTVADNANITVAKRTDNSYYPITVEAYYGYLTASGGIIKDHTESAQSGPAPAILNNASLTFTINTGKENGEWAEVTEIALSKTNMTITGTGTDTSVITFTPAAPSSKAVTVVSNRTDVATVAYNIDTAIITVTGVAAGTATITVTTPEGITATIAVTVNGSRNERQPKASI